MEITSSTDARAHASQIRTHLEHLIEHLKEGGKQVEDPKAQALFETSAEVLIGVRTAVEHFEKGEEKAWR